LLYEFDFSIGEECGGVGGGFSGQSIRAGRVSNDRGNGEAFRQAGQFPFVSVDELGALDQVQWQVPAQAKLRKYYEVRATLGGALGEFQDLGGISGEVANGWIYLGESDFHERAIGYGPR
jgi:hypothetical protein